jgi:hypothetical protein
MTELWTKYNFRQPNYQPVLLTKPGRKFSFCCKIRAVEDLEGTPSPYPSPARGEGTIIKQNILKILIKD